MSHVLVEEAFETHPEFFYPPKNELFLNTSKHGMMNASKAQVMLAEIPFVPHGWRKSGLDADGRTNFFSSCDVYTRNVG